MYHDFRTERQNGHARSVPTDVGERAPDDRSDLSPSEKAKARRVTEMALKQMGQSLSHVDDDPTVAGTAQHGVDPIQHLVQRMPGRGLHHEIQLLTLHLMRQYSPTLDNTIGLCRMLEGDLVITSDDEGLERALTDWAQDVRVGYLAGTASLRGLDAYLNLLADGADEYGLGIGEMILGDQGRQIERLVTPNVRTIETSDRDGDGLYEVFQSQSRKTDGVNTQGRTMQRIDDKPTVQALAFRPSGESEWPYPLAWSAVRSTEAVLRMYESVLNGWWRFGDPSLISTMQFDSDSNPDMVTLPSAGPDGADLQVPAALLMLKDSLKNVMQARRSGQVGDAYAFADGGEIDVGTLGQVDNTLMEYFRDHASVFDGHVISAAPLPAFLFPHVETAGDGLGSARSQSMASIAATATVRRNNLKANLAREVLNTELTLRGDSQFVGEFSIGFEAVDIMDDKLRAEAAKTEAEAEALQIQNAVQAYTEAGERRFSGEAERALEEAGVYPSSNPNT